jgi:hypothetical protein
MTDTTKKRRPVICQTCFTRPVMDRCSICEECWYAPIPESTAALYPIAWIGKEQP